MSRFRFFFGWVALGLASSAPFLACVGDDPPGATAAADGGAVDARPQDAASAADAGPSDAAIDGPRCDPQKPFQTVDRLPGISTQDDELAVWVSGDELTAYVASRPMNGSGRKLLKTTRASKDDEFAAPADLAEMVNVNTGAYTVSTPSLTADDHQRRQMRHLLHERPSRRLRRTRRVRREAPEVGSHRRQAPVRAGVGRAVNPPKTRMSVPGNEKKCRDR